MAEDRGYGILLFGIGALFGGFIVYIIMQKLQTTLALSPLFSQSVPSQIVPQSVVPQAQVIPPQASVSPQAVNLYQEQEKTYKNDEKWVVERGPDGRIKSLNVIRDAKVK